MSKWMWAEMGFSSLGTIAGYAQASVEAKMARAVQDHQNKMAAIQSQMQLDTLNSNRIRAYRNKQLADVDLQKVASAKIAEARVSAAAAGVEGSSVDAGINDLKRQAAGERVKLQRSYEDTQAEIKRAERDTKLSAIYGEDITVHDNPSILGTFAAGANNLLDIWDEHQPEGARSTDKR